MKSNIPIKLGFPDNPLSKTEFSFAPFKNYLMSFAEGTLMHEESFLKFGGLLGMLEFHFQEYSELPNLKWEINAAKNYLQMAGASTLDVVMHAPFMKEKGSGPNNGFNWDFKWLVVPREYRGSDSIIVPGSNIGVQRVKQKELYKTATVADMLGIEVVTYHVTKPGLLIDGQDLENYGKRIADLQGFIKSNNFSIKPSIETGGIALEDLLELSVAHDTLITFDSAHAYLDLRAQGYSIEDANQGVVQWYLRMQDRIEVVHLTQTKDKADLHMKVSAPGILTANEELLKIVAKQDDAPSVMMECECDMDNYFHVASTLREGNYVAVVMGDPVSGKSTMAKILQDALGGRILSSDEIGKQYEGSYHPSLMVSEDRKEEVFQDMHRQLKDHLETGEGTIIDATYHLERRRNDLKDLTDSVKDVYIFRLTNSNESMVKKELKSRAQRVYRLKKHGVPVTRMLHSNTIRERLIKETDEFKINEFKNAHIIEYDIGASLAFVTNPDFTTEVVMAHLANEVRSRYNKILNVIDSKHLVRP